MMGAFESAVVVAWLTLAVVVPMVCARNDDDNDSGHTMPVMTGEVPAAFVVVR
jgi:hypothetical protein